MSVSPFAVTSAILNEQANVSDELRIVACDGGVKRDAKDVLIRAADELELQTRTIALVYAELIDARMRLTAAQDQIKALRKVQVFPTLTMKIGPAPMVLHRGYPT